MPFADALSTGKSIKVLNNVEMKRDFNYIDDIVEGIIRSIGYKNLKTPIYEISNIENSKPINLMEFISCMEKRNLLLIQKNNDANATRRCKGHLC